MSFAQFMMPSLAERKTIRTEKSGWASRFQGMTYYKCGAQLEGIQRPKVPALRGIRSTRMVKVQYMAV